MKLSLKELQDDPQAAVIVVDMQADFYPRGALPVQGGDEIVEPIAKVIEGFSTIVFTQDSHPCPHISFASSYQQMKAFELLSLSQASTAQAFSMGEVQEYLKAVKNSEQVLWPDHCVQGSPGWELDARLRPERAHLIIRKGTKPTVDSYSAFFENDGSSTGLAGFLRARGIRRLFICGLAGDYCVLWTVQDAVREGFEVFFDLSLTRFVDFPSGSRQRAEEYLNQFLLR